VHVGISLAGGTPAGTTIGYDTKLVSGITAGGIGTACDRSSKRSRVKGTKNGRDDVSVLNITI
jgi:hypothetical protein